MSTAPPTGSARSEQRTARGLRDRLFPGDRTVWRVAVAFGAVLAAVIVWQAAILEREYFTGTNSIVDRSLIATTEAGEELCLEDLDVPDGTGRLRLAVQPSDPGTRLRVSLTTGGSCASRDGWRPAATGRLLPNSTRSGQRRPRYPWMSSW